MHKSVLKKEVLEYLNPKANENYIDATLGEGGHAFEILKKNGPLGKVLGIELEPELYKKIFEKKTERLIVINDSFVNLEKIVEREKIKPVSGILFDLGFSSWHIKESKKGFSFLQNEPLDMRYNQFSTDLTAKEIINESSYEEIKNLLKQYGQERFSAKITKAIIESRKKNPIKTTFELVEIIKEAVPSWYQNKKIHFATKTFQSLRIAVNDELNGIKTALFQSLKVLKKGGRIVVISFHSLEDRIIKNYFKEKSKENSINILTKKPIKPSRTEIINNPSSRSAKLRAAEKI